MRKAGYFLLALLCGVIIYGSVVEPRYRLHEKPVEAELPGLPRGWDGRQIALLADFQIGMWAGNTGVIRDAVDRAIRDSVSLALIAGDFVYKPDSSRVRRAVDIIRPLVDAGIPTVAVLGNHDYSLAHNTPKRIDQYAAYLEARLEGIGATVLQNEATPVTAGDDSLWVVGVGSVWAELADVDMAMESLPEGAPRIWLMHNAEAFREIPAEQAHLAFAGHTHGGQVRLIPGRQNSWLDIVRKGEIIGHGWAADSLGAAPNRIYINRGIGFSTIPMRINCRPELTKITLRRSDDVVPTRGPDESDLMGS
ncbi:metallophosphoesterase [Longibacter salinarum]|uniref:Metallophosphoesterase n=1 Tax=Longibacter salinarum TaxID=1850348 RepID=A0A2A8CU96_9BACT|nr:metallophosphoesterase [Longibacter salinarum]PEN11324.1 metallophosphoesterase [Longibacter salinarum]